MNPLHILFLACLYFASASVSIKSCSNRVKATNNATNPITKITYSTTGGRSGNYESLSVSADSLIYLQARRGNEQTIQQKTEEAFWRKLTGSINREDFKRIQSNPGRSLYDGIDSTLSIHYGEEIHTVVNGSEDTTNYKKIKPFTSLLDEKLAVLRTKIVW
jgi:hypothetical protein